jgi:ATP-binding cassette subfamily F protein uup
VTHDRYFLDKVATSILAFEGDGRAVKYPGNYETYRTLKEQSERNARAEGIPSAPSEGRAPARPQSKRGGDAAPEPPPPRARKPGKLSFKEQRELEGMEAAILEAEARKSALETTLSDPSTYQRDGAGVPRLREELDAATAEVERLYARWQELEGRKAGDA